MFKVTIAGAAPLFILQAMLSSLFWGTDAHALTVNGTVRFWDSMHYRSTNTGSRLTGAVGNAPLKTAFVMLMDQDGSCVDIDPGCSENNDDYLNSAYTDANGAFSFANVTNNTDIYVRFDYSVHGSHFIRDATGANIRTRSSPVIIGATGTQTINLNATCTDESRNTTQGLCDGAQDVNDYFQSSEAFANMLAAMAAAETFINPQSMVGYWPNTPEDNCEYAAAAQGTTFCAPDGADNHVIVHEIGHNIHEAALNLTSHALMLLGGGCTSTIWSGLEANEKCVTAEGWASFAAMATWWAQNAVNPEFYTYDVEGDTHTGNSGTGLPCVAYSSSPSKRSGNVTRFFWDLYDSTTVGTSDSLADATNMSFPTITAIWSTFANGSANRQNYESGAHGRNVEDYVAKATAFSLDFYDERDLNCLAAQVD